MRKQGFAAGEMAAFDLFLHKGLEFPVELNHRKPSCRTDNGERQYIVSKCADDCKRLSRWLESAYGTGTSSTASAWARPSAPSVLITTTQRSPLSSRT
jgi:hypothetical protein